LKATKKPKKLRPLHKTQLAVYRSSAKFRTVVCGRRWGKSALALTEVLRAALEGRPPYDPQSPPMVVIAMPTLKQAKKIFWKPLLNMLEGHPSVEKIDRSEHTICFKNPSPLEHYRPEIVVLGANDEDGDRLRGLRIFFIVMDEFQDLKPTILDEIVTPAMADTPNSRALLTGTPKGKVNHLYTIDRRSEQPDQGWASFHYFTSDNPHVPTVELERAEATLPPRIFRQEYRASYEDFPGQIFDCFELKHEVDESTIPTKFEAVVLGVDWGDIHPALTVAGRDESEVWWELDNWHNEPVSKFVKDLSPVLEDDFLDRAIALCERWGVTHAFADPSRPASIEKWQLQGKLKKIKGLASIEAAFNPISEGCNDVNGLFFQNRLFIRNSTDFPDELRGYHRRSDKNGTILDEVAPAQIDHRNDSFRYLLSTYERRYAAKPKLRYTPHASTRRR
jgi:Terminase large subunit, T4likevirus-type, N-terminal